MKLLDLIDRLKRSRILLQTFISYCKPFVMFIVVFLVLFYFIDRVSRLVYGYFSKNKEKISAIVEWFWLKLFILKTYLVRFYHKRIYTGFLYELSFLGFVCVCILITLASMCVDCAQGAILVAFIQISNTFLSPFLIAYMFYVLPLFVKRRKNIAKLKSYLCNIVVKIEQSGNLIGYLSLYDVLFRCGTRKRIQEKKRIYRPLVGVLYSRVLYRAYHYSKSNVKLNLDDVDLLFTIDNDEQYQKLNILVDELFSCVNINGCKKQISELLDSAFTNFYKVNESDEYYRMVSLNKLSNLMRLYIKHNIDEELHCYAMYDKEEPIIYDKSCDSHIDTLDDTNELKKYINGVGIKNCGIDGHGNIICSGDATQRVCRVVGFLIGCPVHSRTVLKFNGMLIDVENKIVNSDDFKKWSKL